MPYDDTQLQTDLEFITSQPAWREADDEGRKALAREVAFAAKQDDPEAAETFVPAIYGAAAGSLVKRGGKFVIQATEEVLKSMPAMGGAALFAAGDAIGLTDTGSGTRLKQGAKTLVDAAGQRLKQLGAGELLGMNLLPGESKQKRLEKVLDDLRSDLDKGAHPEGLTRWLAGDFDNGVETPDEETQQWIDMLTNGIGEMAVAADHMGAVDPEKVKEWRGSDRSPEVPYSLTGINEPGPRELLADYVATGDPDSWEAFQSRVRETDAAYKSRRWRDLMEIRFRRNLEGMPDGLMKDLTERSADMQSSPIDLASSALPLLRGSKLLKAAKAGETGMVGGVLKGAGKEAVQEGTTEYLQDPNAGAGRVMEAAALGAVGSGVLESGMATVGAAARGVAGRGEGSPQRTQRSTEDQGKDLGKDSGGNRNAVYRDQAPGAAGAVEGGVAETFGGSMGRTTLPDGRRVAFDLAALSPDQVAAMTPETLEEAMAAGLVREEEEASNGMRPGSQTPATEPGSQSPATEATGPGSQTPATAGSQGATGAGGPQGTTTAGATGVDRTSAREIDRLAGQLAAPPQERTLLGNDPAIGSRAQVQMGQAVPQAPNRPTLPPDPTGSEDILNWLTLNPILAPRKGEATEGGEYDWREAGEFPPKYRSKIMRNGRPNIDERAQAAFEEGLINEPTPDALVEAIRSAIDNRETLGRVQAQQEANLAAAEAARVRFDKEQAQREADSPVVDADALVRGDRIAVGESVYEVMDIQMDEDGRTLGYDVVDADGQVIGVDVSEGGQMVGVVSRRAAEPQRNEGSGMGEELPFARGGMRAGQGAEVLAGSRNATEADRQKAQDTTGLIRDQASFRRAWPGKYRGGWSVSDAPDTESARSASRLAGALGVRVVWFDDGGAAPSDSLRGWRGSQPRTIYLNKNLATNQAGRESLGPLNVAAHEIMHVLEMEQPDVYADLLAWLKPRLNEGKIREVLARLQYDPVRDNLDAEAVAHLAGELALEPAFYEQVLKEEPGLARRIAAVIGAVLERLKRAFLSGLDLQVGAGGQMTVEEMLNAQGRTEEAEVMRRVTEALRTLRGGEVQGSGLPVRGSVAVDRRATGERMASDSGAAQANEPSPGGLSEVEVLSEEHSSVNGSNYLNLKDGQGRWWQIRVADHDQRTSNQVTLDISSTKTELMLKSHGITQEYPLDVNAIVDQPVPIGKARAIAQATAEQGFSEDQIQSSIEDEDFSLPVLPPFSPIRGLDLRVNYMEEFLRWADEQDRRNAPLSTADSRERKRIMEALPIAKQVMARADELQKSQSRAESGSDMLGRGPTNLATSKTGLPDSPPSAGQVNPESTRAGDGAAPAAARGVRESQFGERVQADERLSPGMREAVPSVFEVRPQQRQHDEARGIIRTMGLAEALEHFRSDDTGLERSVRIAGLMQVAQNYDVRHLAAARRGDDASMAEADRELEKAIEAKVELEILGNETGRALAMYNTWARLSPNGMLERFGRNLRKKRRESLETDTGATTAEVTGAINEAEAEVKSEEEAKVQGVLDATVGPVTPESPQRQKDIRAAIENFLKDPRQNKADLTKTLIALGVPKQRAKAVAADIEGRRKSLAKGLKGKGQAKAEEKLNQAQKSADSILSRLAKIHADPQGWAKKGKGAEDAVRALYRQHVKEPMGREVFAAELQKLGVDESLANRLAGAAQLEIDAMREIDRIKTRERLIQKVMTKLAPKKHDKRRKQKLPKIIETLMEMDAAGLLDGGVTERQVLEAYGKAFDLPELTPEQTRKLTTMAGELNKLPEGVLRQDKAREFLNEMALIEGIPAVEVMMAAWYSNLLSGVGTQAVNVWGNGIQAFAKGMTVAAASPREFTRYVRGLAAGLKQGRMEAAAALRKGVGQKHTLKWDQAQQLGALELLVAQGGPKGLAQWAAYVASVGGLTRYVFRALGAMDLLFYYTANEGMTHLATARTLRKAGMRPGTRAFEAEFIKQLGGDGTQWIADLEQAREELRAAGQALDPGLINRRAYELRMNRRSAETREKAERWADRLTFQQEPEGSGQHLNKLITQLQRFSPLGVPLGRLLVPFNRIVSNLFENALDFTPIGYARAAIGGHLTDKGSWGKMDVVERRERALSATMALGVAGLLYGLSKAFDDDDEVDAPFRLYGIGPGFGSSQRANMPVGWRPYTFKWGDKYISYAETPMGPFLAAVGSWADMERYSASYQKKAAHQRAWLAMKAAMQGFSSQGVLSTVADALDVLSGDTWKNPASLLGNPARGAVPAAGLVRDIGELFDPVKISDDDIYSAMVKDIPVVRNYGTMPDRDWRGQPVSQAGVPVVRRFVTGQRLDPETAWLGRNKLKVPQMPSQIMVGKYTDIPQASQGSPLVDAYARRGLQLTALENGAFTREQWDRFVQRAGSLTAERVKALRTSYEKQYADGRVPERMQEALQKEVETITQAARKTAMGEEMGRVR